MAKWDFGLDSIDDINEQKNTFSFAYNPIGIKRTYGVILRSEDEKRKKLQVHYQIDVICLDTEEDNTYTFELMKHQVYVNEKKPDATIDELVEQCGKVLYPLHIEVNSIGKAVRIINQHAIQQRWAHQKSKILQSYKGKEVDLLVKNMEDILQSVDKTTSLLLQRDWFMVLFFAPIYNTTHTKNQKAQFPLIPYAPSVSYKATHTFEKHAHKEGDILISQKGTCNDDRDEIDIIRGNVISIRTPKQKVKGKLKLLYHIYKNSSIADAITGSCQINFPSGKSKKMEVEIYNLKEKEPISEAEKIALQEQEENNQPPPEKKKKKYFLFGKELKFRK